MTSSEEVLIEKHTDLQTCRKRNLGAKENTSQDVSVAVVSNYFGFRYKFLFPESCHLKIYCANDQFRIRWRIAAADYRKEVDSILLVLRWVKELPTIPLPTRHRLGLCN